MSPNGREGFGVNVYYPFPAIHNFSFALKSAYVPISISPGIRFDGQNLKGIFDTTY